MKQLGVFLLLLAHCRGYLPAVDSPLLIYTAGWREALWEWSTCLTQEYNTMPWPGLQHLYLCYICTIHSPYIASWSFKQLRISPMTEISLIPSAFWRTLHARLGLCKLKLQVIKINNLHECLYFWLNHIPPKLYWPILLNFVFFSLVCSDISKRFTKKLAKSVESNFKVQ